MLNKRILLVFVVVFLTLLVGCLPAPPNQAPVITSTPVTDADVGFAYTYDVNATDPDEDTLTYSLDVKPTDMTINSATGVINWTPAVEGEFNVVAKVSDGDLDITQSFIITVVEEEPGVTPTPAPTPTKKYTITATAEPGGTISPSGAVTVNKGANKTFTITPYSPFYRLLDVLVDGGSVGAVSPYTFTNVTADHTIDAYFIFIGPVYNQDKDEHYNTIQEAIDDADNPSSDTILVMAGTYNERLTINKPLDLRGAPDNGSIITLDGLGIPNPNILIDISSGVSNVSVTGFTLIGSPTFHYADEVVVRCYADNITIEDNIINGYVGVLYKGPGQGQDLTIHNNYFIVNKDGVICQPGSGSNLTISDNIFTMGSSPVVLPIESQAIYMSNSVQSSVTGNTATNFNLRGLSGSSLSNLNVSENTFDGNDSAISIWGGSTFITISGNVLSNSQQYGIEIKGQDITITDNEIINNGDCGIFIDKHVIDTERVAITDNDISDNSNYGVFVNVADVPEIVDAENNWWGHESGPYHATNLLGSGNAVSDKVDFKPWIH